MDNDISKLSILYNADKKIIKICIGNTVNQLKLSENDVIESLLLSQKTYKKIKSPSALETENIRGLPGELITERMMNMDPTTILKICGELGPMCNKNFWQNKGAKDFTYTKIFSYDQYFKHYKDAIIRFLEPSTGTPLLYPSNKPNAMKKMLDFFGIYMQDRFINMVPFLIIDIYSTPQGLILKVTAGLYTSSPNMTENEMVGKIMYLIGEGLIRYEDIIKS
jgi:hypothetical protein